MQSFLEEVVQTIRLSEDITETTTFVLPSKRAGTFLRDAIAKSAGKTTFAPKIYSIEVFVEEISELKKASNTELLFLLYQTYLDTSPDEKENFHDFTRWGQVLLQDFNEIDRYLVEPVKIFNYLAAIKEVSHWYLKPSRTELMQNYINFWNTLEDLYLAFNQTLKERNIGHQGLIYREAVAKLKGYLAKNATQRFIFVGFNALNTAESKIIQETLSRAYSDIYWDIDNCFIKDPIHDAGYFLRQHQKNWPYLQKNGLKGVSDYYSATKNIHLIGAPKNVSQVKYMGQLLQKLQLENPDLLKKSAVVLGDETLLNPLLNAIPKEITRVNITMGFPLNKTLAASFFSQFFELAIQSDSRGWFYKNLLSFLSNNYMQLLLLEHKSPGIVTLESNLAAKNLTYINAPQLSSYQLLPDNLMPLFFFEDSDPRSFIEKCLSVILVLRDTFKNADLTLELEYLYHFHQLFEKLRQLTETFPFVSELKSLYRLFKELLSTETVDFQGEPLEGLQVMGMLESRNLDFETVIVSSVNEGILPSGKSNNSFIPFDLKRDFGLPTYKEKDAVYTYHFYRLLQRAKNVFLLYNTEPDVLEGGEPSRLITQLQTENIEAHTIRSVIASPEIEPIPLSQQRISKTAEVMTKLMERSQKGFSPTSLSRYIRNPVEFYKTEILGIKEQQEIEETIAANTMGTIIHESLEALYHPLIGQFLSSDKLKECYAKIPLVVKENFLKHFSEKSLTGKNLIAFNVIERHIKNFIRLEIQDSDTNRVKIIALEMPITIDFDVPGLSFPVRIKGVLDRVEERNGRTRITDFKTGKVLSTQLELYDWDTLISDYDFSKAFQLLCYGYLFATKHGSPEIDAGVVSFKNLKSGFLPFATKERKGSRKKEFGINEDNLAMFKKQLTALITEICNPEIPFVEKEI